ncbi:SCP2 sterol-binding domain-containing protein [Streptomyces sp. NPDC050803]|uniref:SCP2 sterol-binding domain-containing protein n=1 Tax=unclassified Streptomyces TaxID=2593676 RepID=UPI003431D4E9
MGGDSRSRLTDSFRNDPTLAEFLLPFPQLPHAEDGDPGSAFERLGELVAGSTLRARVHFRISADDAARSWTLELGPDACTVSSERAHRPDLEVLVGAETWRQLATGSLSPLEAFALGDMRVRGDIRVALHLMQLLRQQ